MKGLIRSLRRGRPLDQIITKLKLHPRRENTFTVDGAAGVGFGSLVLGGLPEANILLLGAVGYMAISGPGGDAGLVDAWNGDFGIGTTPASDGTITGDDVNVIGSTAIGPAVAEAAPRTRGETTVPIVPVILDNTDGSLELNLNVLVDDADISADGILFTVDGDLWVSFVTLGDD